MQSLLERLLAELNLGGVINKQRSIKKLFPAFDDRVKAVGTMGGLRMVSTRPQLWYFQVHSGTKTNRWYDQVLRFTNIEEVVKDKAMDMRLWKKDKSGVDMRLLAREVLNTCDLELRCSCPAFRYWGSAYILTQKQAKYKPPENRKPVKRNPREYGAVCKHYQLLLDYLFSYDGTMQAYIETFYSRYVKEGEDEARATLKGFKGAGKALGKKEEEPEFTVPPEKKEVQTEFDFMKEPPPEKEKPKEEQMEFDFMKEPFPKEEPSKEEPSKREEIPPTEEEEEMAKEKQELKAIEDLVKRIQTEPNMKKKQALQAELQKHFDLGASEREPDEPFI